MSKAAIVKGLAKVGVEMFVGGAVGAAVGMLFDSNSKDDQILEQLGRIETQIADFQNLAKAEFNRLGIAIKSTDARSKVNELKSLFNSLQRYLDASDKASTPTDDQKEVIKQRCIDIDKQTMPAVEFIYEELIVTNVASKSLLLLSWEDIMTTTSRPIDPVDAYIAIKSLSLWYQSALGNAKVLLTWQQKNDANKTRAKIAASSIKKVDELIGKWDQALEISSDCILPYRIVNWANAFLPEERRGLPIEVAWDAFREPFPAERNIYGVRLTQPPPQEFFKTGLQVWKGITNSDIKNTDMVFRIFRDNEASTYTIGVADALNFPAMRNRQNTPGTNRLSVGVSWSDFMPCPIYHNYPDFVSIDSDKVGWKMDGAVPLVFQIDPATVTNPTSSNFGMTIKGAPSSRVPGRGLRFGDNDFFRFNSDDKHGRYQFRIFPSSLPNSKVPII